MKQTTKEFIRDMEIIMLGMLLAFLILPWIAIGIEKYLNWVFSFMN